MIKSSLWLEFRMATFRRQLLNRRQAKVFLLLPRLFFPQESAILHANHKNYIS